MLPALKTALIGEDHWPQWHSFEDEEKVQQPAATQQLQLRQRRLGPRVQWSGSHFILAILYLHISLIFLQPEKEKVVECCLYKQADRQKLILWDESNCVMMLSARGGWSRDKIRWIYISMWSYGGQCHVLCGRLQGIGLMLSDGVSIYSGTFQNQEASKDSIKTKTIELSVSSSWYAMVESPLETSAAHRSMSDEDEWVQIR